MRRMTKNKFLIWSPPVSQFPIGETRATTTARSNSYQARVDADTGLELEASAYCRDVSIRGKGVG